jgi:GntR family transcriptional regulator
VSAHHGLIPITRSSEVPLHVQLREHLLDLIERGELAPGEKLLRERELAARHGVSLAPVRQAILDLVKDGYLDRVQGRGTFVRERKVEEPISILSSFTRSMRAKGLEPEIDVLRQERAEPPAAIRARLRRPDGDLLLLQRVARLAGEPVAALEAWLPVDQFEFLLEEPLGTRSLYETIRERTGIEGVRAESVIEVIRCDREQAALLGVRRGAPALEVAGITYDQQDEPFESSRVIYREDRFRFVIESVRTSTDVVHVIPLGGTAHQEEEGNVGS